MQEIRTDVKWKKRKGAVKYDACNKIVAVRACGVLYTILVVIKSHACIKQISFLKWEEWRKRSNCLHACSASGSALFAKSSADAISLVMMTTVNSSGGWEMGDSQLNFWVFQNLPYCRCIEIDSGGEIGPCPSDRFTEKLFFISMWQAKQNYKSFEPGHFFLYLYDTLLYESPAE